MIGAIPCGRALSAAHLISTRTVIRQQGLWVPGLGRSLVYRLIATGVLASIKIGRSRRIPVWAIDEFIAWRLEQEARVAGVRE
jgi:excisionase family DNA binding protein